MSEKYDYTWEVGTENMAVSLAYYLEWLSSRDEAVKRRSEAAKRVQRGRMKVVARREETAM